MMMPTWHRATYVVPLRCREAASNDLVDYLRWLSELMPVIVADGSAPPVFKQHQGMWGDFVQHLAVSSHAVNGKVAGVADGVAAASTPFIVIADDDIRYDERALAEVMSLLGEYDAVIPQNYFAPLPWHARWDSARSLVNRAFGHDYPGTIAVRRLAMLGIGGYCGAVLFENLELHRTLTAGGHRVWHADDVFVRRCPPTFRHFLGQRVRQAYDSGAQRQRQAAELAILPCTVVAAALGGPAAIAALALAAVGIAEIGRRRHGGCRVFPWRSALWAPCWILERGVCAWLAVYAGGRGGVRYSGQRLSTSAHPLRSLRPPECPESKQGVTCRCDTALRPKVIREVGA